jgi:hypothetical protein
VGAIEEPKIFSLTRPRCSTHILQLRVSSSRGKCRRYLVLVGAIELSDNATLAEDFPWATSRGARACDRGLRVRRNVN